jgi:glc operon protein GlcG
VDPGVVAVKYAEAQALVAAAHLHAAHLGCKVTAAVVDEGGHLVSLGRMDGSRPLSRSIAEAKAVGAVLLHRDGDQLAEIAQQRPDFFAAVSRLAPMPLIPSGGSKLLYRGERIVGALGVSGGSTTQDNDCAEAASITFSKLPNAEGSRS